jgi:hypothetical protein
MECRAFSYDPVKRGPEIQAKISKLISGQFSLFSNQSIEEKNIGDTHIPPLCTILHLTRGVKHGTTNTQFYREKNFLYIELARVWVTIGCLMRGKRYPNYKRLPAVFFAHDPRRLAITSVPYRGKLLEVDA